MSGICITGLVQDDLNFVATLLQRAGVEPMYASQRDASMSIERWHEQVVTLPIERYVQKALTSTGSADLNIRQQIGRLWEQLASDIFIANMGVQTWAWADTRSAEMLPFWVEFDPQIKFVLVVCSFERYLASALKAKEASSLDQLRKYWRAYHQALVHFQRTHPTRSILIDFDDVLLRASGFVELCQTRFDLALNPGGLNAASDYPIDALVGAMVSKLRIPQRDGDGFEDDLYASLTPVPLVAENASLATFMSSDQQASPIDQYRQLLLTISSNALSQVTEQTESAPELSSDVIDLQYRDVEQDELALARVKELEQENEILLSKLKQAQTEVVELKHRNSEANHAIESTAKELEEENELLLAQLHQVQEELENYFLKYKEASSALETLQSRFQKLAARNPGQSELDGIEILSFDPSAAAQTQWKLKGLESAGRLIDELGFSTSIENKEGCVSFACKGKLPNGLIRWPAPSNVEHVTIAAVGDETTGPARARALQSLSTSDWQLVKVITAFVVKETEKPNLLSIPAGFNQKAVSQAMAKLNGHLNKLPPIFHFDEIRLRSYQEEPEYEYLWFSFTNVLFGDRHVPQFDFRFATVNIPVGTFGTNPRLEFHERGSTGLFSNWFEESTDDYGAKLELRFANTPAMDMGVWGRIAQNDQMLIAALIAQLPIFIDLVKQGDTKLRRSWDDWTALSDTVHRYLLQFTAEVNTTQDDEGEGADTESDSHVESRTQKPKASRNRPNAKKASSTPSTK